MNNKMRTRKEIEQKLNELKNFSYDWEQRIEELDYEQSEFEEYLRIIPRIHEDIDTLEWVLGIREVI